MVDRNQNQNQTPCTGLRSKQVFDCRRMNARTLERAESTWLRVVTTFFLEYLRTELTLPASDLVTSESELISITCSGGGGAGLT